MGCVGSCLDNRSQPTSSTKPEFLAKIHAHLQLRHFSENGEMIHIDASAVEFLFTPFSVDDLLRHHEGHGLSLAIARKLVE